VARTRMVEHFPQRKPTEISEPDIAEIKADICLLAGHLAETSTVPPNAFDKPFGLPDRVIARTPNALQRLYATRADLVQLARPLTIRHLRIHREMTHLDWALGQSFRPVRAFTRWILIQRLRVSRQVRWRVSGGANPIDSPTPQLPSTETEFFGDSYSLTNFDFEVERKVAIRLRNWLKAFNIFSLIIGLIAISYQSFIFVHPTLGLGSFGVFVKEWAPLMLPMLYGSLGALLAGLRSFTQAWREKLLDERVVIEATTGVALGCIAGLMIGLTLNSVGSFPVGAAFLAGYCAIGALGRLDDLVVRRFRSQTVATFDLLQPVNLTTHLVAGAVFTVLFLASWGLLLPNSFLWQTLNVSGEPPRRTSVLPMIAVAGGALGAWLDVTLNIIAFAAIQSNRRASDQKTPFRFPPPFMQYLTGAFAGFAGAIILPGSILSATADLDAFNPSTLAVIAVIGGYWMARTLRSVVGSLYLDNETGVAAVEEGVRRALAPSPLVNYSGRMTTDLLRADTLASCISEGEAKIPPEIPDYVLNVRFEPDAVDDAAYTPVTIEDGIDGGEAIFDLEISADDFAPRRRRVQIAARTGIVASIEPLKYSLLEKGKISEESRFRITISQSGRVVQFVVLRVAMA
jgi:hypothetical protein